MMNRGIGISGSGSSLAHWGSVVVVDPDRKGDVLELFIYTSKEFDRSHASSINDFRGHK